MANRFNSVVHAVCWHFGIEDVYYKNVDLVGKALLVVGVAVGGVYALRRWRAAQSRSELEERLHRAIAVDRQRRRDELQRAVEESAAFKDDADVLEAIENGGWLAFERVRDGQLSLERVVGAYLAKCCAAQELCNPITHFLSDALDEARRLDAIAASSTSPLPPLYGCVFSIKEFYDVRGCDSTAGLSARLQQPASEDAPIVRAMRRLGALAIVKSNMPQTACSFASSNPIYGETTNPNSSERGPGGSSSGEAALLALDGSMCGWGSDLGGSVRIPAHFSGVASLRPMNRRFSIRAIGEVVEGYRGVQSTYGVLARDVRMIAKVYAEMLTEAGMFSEDREVVPLAWRPDVYESTAPLRIGYFEDDGYFPPTPGCRRAVREAVAALEKLGHEMVPFVVPQAWESFALWLKLVMGDRVAYCGRALQNDIVDPVIEGIAGLSTLLRETSACGQRRALSDARAKSKRQAAGIEALLGICRPEDLFEAFAARDAYRQRFLDQWQSARLDAMLSPVVATPALPLAVPAHLLDAISYTTRYNLLDLPAGVVPITVENGLDQALLDAYDTQGDALLQLAKDSVRGAIGMPIGVQIAGLPYAEETCLRVMRQLQEAIGEGMTKRVALRNERK